MTCANAESPPDGRTELKICLEAKHIPVNIDVVFLDLRLWRICALTGIFSC